jgi:hypothetical protein
MARLANPDQQAICSDFIRVSPRTKKLLNDLKKKHGLATLDSVINYYLPNNAEVDKPVFMTAKQAYNLTHHHSVNRLIKEASREIMKKSDSSVNKYHHHYNYNTNSRRNRRAW